MSYVVIRCQIIYVVEKIGKCPVTELDKAPYSYVVLCTLSQGKNRWKGGGSGGKLPHLYPSLIRTSARLPVSLLCLRRHYIRRIYGHHKTCITSVRL